MSERSASARFTIGEWQVHPASNQLVRNGEKIVVEPQVMEVLTYLAHHAGEVISHDELIDKLWRGTIVAEGAIYQNIAKLRHALRDDPNDPRYIETIPRGGYRLIANVRLLEGSKLEKIRSRFLSFTQLNEHKTALVIVTALALGLIYLGYEKFVFDRTLDEVSASRITRVEDINEASRWKKSIAVLPFVNMTGDPDKEYFSDGLSEEILTLLAKIPGLKVIGRTSSFAFKGKNDDLRVIGQTLGVKTVLDGSVRQSGDRVRITAQLVNVSDGAHIWFESYDLTMTDIFSVQDEVAAAIIDALQIHVSEKPTRGRPTENAEAYALFLEARASYYGSRLVDAEELLLKAIEIDPKFAEAFELLAATYWDQAGSVIPAAKGQKFMFQAAAKALAIDPDLVLAQAYYRMGNLETRSILGAIEAFQRVVLEKPNQAEPLLALAWDLLLLGYLREALGYAERFVELDPLSPAAKINLANALYAVGRTDEGIAALEALDHLSPYGAKWMLGEVNLVEKQDDSAIAYFEAALEQGGSSSSWVRELVTAARDPATGQAYLDRRIPEIVASMPEEDAYSWQLNLTKWYLYFGFLDRYFEFILATDITNATWTDSEELIYDGTLYRKLGFTAHPKYLEIVESLEYVQLWEQRWPPDFCEKMDGQWVCE